jgi:hypothetical protein
MNIDGIPGFCGWDIMRASAQGSFYLCEPHHTCIAQVFISSRQQKTLF